MDLILLATYYSIALAATLDTSQCKLARPARLASLGLSKLKLRAIHLVYLGLGRYLE